MFSLPYPPAGSLCTRVFCSGTKLQVVAEARRRLLEQHGAGVEGYLPKGALKSKDELEYVRELSKRHTNGQGARW